MEHMKDGREFDNEREFEKYVQDLTKGIEMLNLLLEANLYYKEKQNNNVNAFFNDITNRMSEIRNGLRSILVFIPNDRGEPQIVSFYDYDFAFPVFNKSFHPILPDFVDNNQNYSEISDVKAKILEFNEI